MTVHRTLFLLFFMGFLGASCGLRSNPVIPLRDSGVGEDARPDAKGEGSDTAADAARASGGARGAAPSGTGGAAAGSGGLDGGFDLPDGTPGDGSPVPLGLGAVCSEKAQCATGNCVDGVCCDTACAGSCSQCNLKGVEGTCTAVPAGMPPVTAHPACAKAAAATCKQNGLCDGKSGCALYANGESCGTGTCSAVTQRSVTGSACDGLGTCKPAAEMACAPYKCKPDGVACAMTCVTDNDCQGQPCVGGACGKVANGNRCTTGVQCTSGNCVDGVCCGTASCPTCQACNLATPGTCSNKPQGAPDAACTIANCKTGSCNNAGACAPAPDGPMCGTNAFCRAGACGPCTPNQPCQPPNPCKNGTTSCTTGVMACLETTNKGVNTPCGAGSSCAGTTKTNAAVCNATGTCGATAQNCPTGCNAARTDCLSCSGSETACDGACCGGSTPACSAGACVQCSSDAYCSGSTPTCDVARHRCVCRRPNQGNLFTDGGFDTGPGTWLGVDPNFGTFWKSDDADGCAGSGSLYGGQPNSGVTSILASPCIPITGGKTYFVGIRYKYGISPNAAMACNLDSHPDENCQHLGSEEFGPSLFTTSSLTWQSASLFWTAPPDVTHATLICYPIDSYLDQVYMNLNPTF